jgi:hypothetical protein
VEEGHSVFCAEDDVDQSKVERLRHGGTEVEGDADRAGPWPLNLCGGS